MKRRTVIQQLSAISATALAPASLLAQGKTYKIALVMKALSNPFFHAMEVGAREAAKTLGVELFVQGTNKETDVAQQVSIVENFMTRGVDAIVIAPASSEGLVPVLFRAQAQGIKVVNIDNPLDEKTKKQFNFQCPFVGSDNAMGASLACHDLVAAMGGQGEVAILEGIPGVINAELRKQGARRILNAEPKIQVVASQTAEWETEQGYQVFSNMLTAHPNITGLFASNDSMALGAIRAIDAAGKTGQIAVTSYDNLDAAQEAVLAGAMISTIDQHPEKMGEFGVQTAKDILDGKTVADYIPTPLEVIDFRSLSMK
ncbi:MAG: substrate-binding domain-containing protein [Candidatus Hinthialibacter antarcticus]|nr:substrate-binding domain-containing protein [Candidatus Hinthialibacter antarcticus]